MNGESKALDTTVRIVTPENIAFNYRLAGPFRRLPAYLVDVLILALTFAVVSVGLMKALGFFSGLGLILVLFLIAEWGYGGLFETYWNGQTPGKRAFGIRVISTGGVPINGQQAMLRNVLRTIDFFPFLLLTAILAYLFTRRFQRLGDLAADTMVVVDERHQVVHVPSVAEEATEGLLEQIPLGFEGDARLAEALASYVGRREILSVPRRHEVSSHLAGPLIARFGLPEQTDPDALVCAVYRRVFL